MIKSTLPTNVRYDRESADMAKIGITPKKVRVWLSVTVFG